MNQLFVSSEGKHMTADQIIAEMIAFMAIAPSREYKVIIGSDSLRRPNGTADFVTAIVIHRVGNGGRYFWRRTVTEKRFHTLRDRILEEVLLSLEVAHAFLEAAKVRLFFDFAFEIHVDAGMNGATKALIQELVGIIRANNFEAKTKPDSYAASKVADRHV